MVAQICLKDQVIPWFKKQDVRVLRIVTDHVQSTVEQERIMSMSFIWLSKILAILALTPDIL
ncbi:hypothetical protein NEOC95_000723 [Neochlamydia sp. AcF95]|nr:hypothetical protein [Neochlamydia sp. AcF95]